MVNEPSDNLSVAQMWASLLSCLGWSKKQCGVFYWAFLEAKRKFGYKKFFKSVKTVRLYACAGTDGSAGHRDSSIQRRVQIWRARHNLALEDENWSLNTKYSDFPFFFPLPLRILSLFSFFQAILIRRCSLWLSYLPNVLGNSFVQIMLALVLKAE